jgi:hypothetical protein
MKFPPTAHKQIGPKKMKNLSGLLKVILFTSFAAGLSTATLEAQTIPAPGDLFSSADTVTVSSTLDPALYPVSALLDHSGSGAFVFNDDGLNTVEYQSMSISGFDSAIDSLSIYDYYGPGRNPDSVIISYSSTAQTSLDPSDYTALNGGLAYALPKNANGYINTTSPALPDGGEGRYITYDTLSGLAIPAGTQSILLSFDTVESSGTFYGGAFSEIQAFAPAGVEVVPEPSAWAMLLLGLGVMVALRCFRRGTSVIS